MFERQPGARPDLDFIASWDGDGEAGGDQATIARAQDAVLSARDVEARAPCGSASGERQPLAVREASDLDLEHHRKTSTVNGQRDLSLQANTGSQGWYR